MAKTKRKPVELKTNTVSIGNTGLTIEASPLDNARVPKVDPHYFFRKDLVEAVLFAIHSNQNCMLVGGAGTGKTSLVEQVAALANQNLRRVNVHGESDTTIFVGRDKPADVDGKRSLVYVPGILARAMEEGDWLLIDEIDSALQPILFVLQQVLEDNGKLLLEDGKGSEVKKHPNFRLFASGNTIGIAGRHRLLYSGTMTRMNEATLDRFGVVVHVPPLLPEQEAQVIGKNVPELDADFVTGIVKIANEIRVQLDEEQISCTFSTRKCLQWAKGMAYGFHPLRAAHLAVLNKLNQDDAKVIEGVIQRYFGS